MEFPQEGFSGALQMIVTKPFAFYFSAQGYHWLVMELHIAYWIFLLYYTLMRPISGDLSVFEETNLDVILWTCNVGFIIHEVFECMHKGTSEYLNLGVKGQTNLMDVVLCSNWIFLGFLRILFRFTDS